MVLVICSNRQELKACHSKPDSTVVTTIAEFFRTAWSAAFGAVTGSNDIFGRSESETYQGVLPASLPTVSNLCAALLEPVPSLTYSKRRV